MLASAISWPFVAELSAIVMVGLLGVAVLVMLAWPTPEEGEPSCRPAVPETFDRRELARVSRPGSGAPPAVIDADDPLAPGVLAVVLPVRSDTMVDVLPGHESHDGDTLPSVPSHLFSDVPPAPVVDDDEELAS